MLYPRTVTRSIQLAETKTDWDDKTVADFGTEQTVAEIRATLARLRATRGAERSGAREVVADIPSLATTPLRTPTPMPKFRAVGTRPPVALRHPEVKVTFRSPSNSDIAQTSLVKLPTAAPTAVAITTAYLT